MASLRLETSEVVSWSSFMVFLRLETSDVRRMRSE